MSRESVLQELMVQGKSREIVFSNQEDFDMIMEWMHGEENCQNRLRGFYASCCRTRTEPKRETEDIGFVDDVLIGQLATEPETGIWYIEGRTCLTDKPDLLIQRLELIDCEGQIIKQSSEAELQQDDTSVRIGITAEELSRANAVLYCAVWQDNEVMKGKVTARGFGSLGEAGPGIKSITLEKPVAKNGRDTVVVLYKRYPKEAENYDYLYSEKIEQGKQRTYLEIECTVQMMENAVIRMVDFDNIVLKLICPGRGMVEYGKEITEKVFPLLALTEEERKGKDFKIEFLNKGTDGDWRDWDVSLPNARLPIWDKVDLELHIPYELTDGKSGILIVSSSSEVTGANLCRAQKLYLLWGCLEETTKIEMADGSSKCIRDVQIGELVRGKNGPSRVRNLFHGQEEQLLCIETADGASICSTGDHVFCTARGNVKAEELCGSDLLETVKGRSAITGIYPVAGGIVYNIDLEEEGFFYAEGILNGDFKSQNRLFGSSSEHKVSSVDRSRERQLTQELLTIKELMGE